MPSVTETLVWSGTSPSPMAPLNCSPTQPLVTLTYVGMLVYSSVKMQQSGARVCACVCVFEYASLPLALCPL